MDNEAIISPLARAEREAGDCWNAVCPSSCPFLYRLSVFMSPVRLSHFKVILLYAPFLHNHLFDLGKILHAWSWYGAVQRQVFFFHFIEKWIFAEI